MGAIAAGGKGVARLVRLDCRAQLSGKLSKESVHLILRFGITKAGNAAAGEGTWSIKFFMQVLAVFQIRVGLMHCFAPPCLLG